MSTGKDEAIEESYNEEIRAKDEIVIDGYIRGVDFKIFSNKASFYGQIPNIINGVCFVYYHVSKDRFDPKLHGPALSLNEECDVVTYDKKTDAFYYENVAFLSNIVNDGIHEWRFKIENQFGLMYIGIWKTKYDEKKAIDCIMRHHGKYGNEASYSLNLRHGKLRGDLKASEYGNSDKYCTKCRTGDTLDVILDLKKYELSFCVNDIDQGKAFNVEQNMSYRAGVNIRQTDSIKLLMYTYTK